MREKINEPTPLRPEGGRLLDAQMVPIDLPAFRTQIRQEQSWKTGDRNAITVFKTDGMRIVLVALHNGATMAEHSADGILSIQVLEGQIDFQVNGKHCTLAEGQMICLHPEIPHAVIAHEESIFLLTLASPPEGN